MILPAEEKLHDFESEASQHSFLRQVVVRDRLHLRIPSRVDWVELAVMHLANKAEAMGACEHDRVTRIVTAMTEAITNAIVHGNLEISSELKESTDGAFARVLAERSSDPEYAGRVVDIEMDYDGRQCVWTIRDQGPGFDVEKVLARLNDDNPETILASGRGIMLMKAFLDDVAWFNGGREVRLTLNKTGCEEHRAEPRVSTLEAVRAVPLAEGGAIDWDKAFDAVATNLSTGGIGLLADASATPQRLMIEMNVGGQPVYVPAEVCHFTRVDDQVLQIGAKFVTATPLPADAPPSEQARAIDDLLAKATAAPAHDERRRHQRVAYTKPLSVVTDDGQERVAVGRDLSKAGMAFVAEFQLPRGASIEVVLDPQGATPLRLQAQVMRCQQLAGRFHDVGVKFLD